MPRVKGTLAGKRSVLSGVGHSILLYATPIWKNSLKFKKYRNKLDSTQRMTTGIISGFATEIAFAKWQERWSSENSKALWTRRLIKDIKTWTERSHGNTDYWLTQFLQYMELSGPIRTE